MKAMEASLYREIPIDKIKLFGGKRYFSSKQEKVDELAESIKENGILEPLIVRKEKEDELYELIAGETRLRAAAKLNLETVPCEIIDVDDEKAQRIYGESNRYREDISIMQKAFMLKYSKNLLFCPEVKSESFCKVFCEFDDDEEQRQAYRYLLLTELTPMMQELVDKKIINVNAGAAASILPDKVQDEITLNLSGTKRVLTEQMVVKIKETYEKDYLPFGRNISQTAVDEIITKYQPEKIKKVSVKISKDLIRKLPEEVRSKKALSPFIENLIKEYIENCC